MQRKLANANKREEYLDKYDKDMSTQVFSCGMKDTTPYNALLLLKDRDIEEIIYK